MLFKINSEEEYKLEYKKSIENPEEFWAEKAARFKWIKKWDKTLDWNFIEPKVNWFINGKLNITENCLDIHARNTPNKIAYLWEANNPEEGAKTYTYKQLLEEVCKCANALKTLGVSKGDRVCIYLPMVPELAISVLACARIGAIHSVVFGGFSANALSGRIQDADCKLVITSDGAYRGNKEIPMKTTVDEALELCPYVENVLVLKRTNTTINMLNNRDIWWHE